MLLDILGLIGLPSSSYVVLNEIPHYATTCLPTLVFAIPLNTGSSVPKTLCPAAAVLVLILLLAKLKLLKVDALIGAFKVTSRGFGILIFVQVFKTW